MYKLPSYHSSSARFFLLLIHCLFLLCTSCSTSSPPTHITQGRGGSMIPSHPPYHRGRGVPWPWVGARGGRNLENVSLYVCMFVWMYGCMDVWMYVCMDVWMYVWMYGCMDVWMYGCMDVWMYGCTDVWMYGCMDVWMYACMHACMYVRSDKIWRGSRTDRKKQIALCKFMISKIWM